MVHQESAYAPQGLYPQFKEQAVRLASAPGAVVENVAHELAVATWTLRRWMKEQLGSSRKTPPKPRHLGLLPRSLTRPVTPRLPSRATQRPIERIPNQI